MSRAVTIWDAPTRLFHWGLAISVAACWITASGDPERHAFFGWVVIALLVFRVIWGVIGSETARFASFVRGPSAVAAFIRSKRFDGWGHNPLAGAAVLALMAGAAFAALTGIGLEPGGEAGLHATAANLLAALIGLHLLSIATYHAFGWNLLGPMLSGGRTVADDAPPAPAIRRDRAAPAALAAAVAITVALSYAV